MVSTMEDLEHRQHEYEQSLYAVAESMKHCVKMAESFANAVKHAHLGEPSTFANGRRKSLLADEITGGKRKRGDKKLKDPNAPKRPASAYIVFQNELRGKLKAEHPDLSNNDLMAHMSQLWSKLSDNEKAKYHQQVAVDKTRYQNELAAYEARTPEQVAADEAAVAAALEAKKAGRKRGRKPKDAVEPPKEEVKKASKVQAVPAPVKEASSSDESEDSSDSDSSEDVAIVKSKTKKAATPSSDESEEEDESSEEEEPPVKKSKTSKPRSRA